MDRLIPEDDPTAEPAIGACFTNPVAMIAGDRDESSALALVNQEARTP
jgi:hypothetical protein